MTKIKIDYVSEKLIEFVEILIKVYLSTCAYIILRSNDT